MPEIQANRNDKICDRLVTWCEECARAGSIDCTGHGGRLSEDTTVLGKRLGHDVFSDFRAGFEYGGGTWGKGLVKPQTKRPNSASSNPFSSDRDGFLGLPAPKLVVSPSKSPASSVAVPSLPKLVPQSRLEPSSFADLSSTSFTTKPTPSVPTLIKPTASVPTPIKPTASVPASAPAVAAPNTDAVALPADPSTPSDLAREQGPLDPDQDENSCKEGGVRFRENLGKYVVEYRPPRFKWKLWMGTYTTVEEGRRACDCARFYAGQDKGGFYFKDSPALFGNLGPLNRPFTSVSKDVKDKAFNVELKKRAKLVIKKVLDAQRSRQSIDVTRPTVKKPLADAIVQSLQVLGARTIGRSDRLSSSCEESQPNSQESLPNSAVTEENEIADSARHEVASVYLASGDSLTNLDHFSNLVPLSDAGTLYPGFPSPPAFVRSFSMNSEHQDLEACIQSSLDFADDLADDFTYDLSYVKLWNHDELP